MAKSTLTYTNFLNPLNDHLWLDVPDTHGCVKSCTLSLDTETGEYTRLTKFLPGMDGTKGAGKVHNYPEEVFIISGDLYDVAFDKWLYSGDYASRPPGELHGPFKTQKGCLVLEVSFPNKKVT